MASKAKKSEAAKPEAKVQEDKPLTWSQVNAENALPVITSAVWVGIQRRAFNETELQVICRALELLKPASPPADAPGSKSAKPKKAASAPAPPPPPVIEEAKESDSDHDQEAEDPDADKEV